MLNCFLFCMRCFQHIVYIWLSVIRRKCYDVTYNTVLLLFVGWRCTHIPSSSAKPARSWNLCSNSSFTQHFDVSLAAKSRSLPVHHTGMPKMYLNAERIAQADAMRPVTTSTTYIEWISLCLNYLMSKLLFGGIMFWLYLQELMCR